MVLHFKSKSPLRVKKLAGALIAIAAFLVQPLITLNIPSAFAVSGPQYYVRTDGSDANCDGTADVADADTTTAACAKATVQAGINTAGGNATLNLGSGTFSASQYLVLAGHEGLTIDGKGKTNTILELTAASDGFKVQANNVTLKDFTIDGTTVANYGLRAQGVDNITVDNVKATHMHKTGFDINGVTNSSFTDLTATDNGGNGFSVTDTENLTFTNTRSSGNAWGGMGIYTKGGVFPGRCGVDGISFSGVMNLQEVQALYTGIDSVSCTSISNLTVPSTSLPYKVTLNNSDPQDIYTGSLTNAESIVGAGSALSPVVTDTQTGHYVVVSGQTIQSVINIVSAGSVIDVPAGTYAENVSVNKALTLIGAGSDNTGTVISGTSGTGLSLAAGSDATHRVVVKDLKVTGFTTGVTASSYNTLENVVSIGNTSYGISLNNLNGLAILNSKFNNNTVGLKLGSTASANNVQISGSQFNSNSTHGWYSDKNAASGSYLTNLNVSDTSFSDNGNKGFYTEKLSDATFERVTIDNSGSTGSYGSGLNINLKYGNYQNVTINDAVVTNSGLGDTTNGTGINIEARDDGSYASNPATLNNVTISGGQVTGNQVGLRFGESGKNNAGPTGVTIMGVNLSGNVAEAVNNQTTATITAVGNWWGDEAGSTASQYTGDVVVTPWCNVADCSSLFSDESVQLEATGGVATTDSGAPLTLSGSTSDGTISAVIPESTTVTSSDLGWDGTITPPTISAYEAPGSNKITSLAITVGSDSSSLSFDKGVRLVLPGQAGKHIGFLSSIPGSVFTEITTVCSADDSSQPVSPANECKIDVGSDLVIWTKHFTTFVTFTLDTTKPAGSFTAPVTGSTHKGLVDISADVSDSETGLNNLQVVLRNSSNAVVGNWSYNVQTGTANTIAGTGTISFSGTPASGTVTVQNVNTASFATGKYNLRLFTTDVAGNGNSAIYSNFYVDNSAPDGSIAPFSLEQKGDTTVTVDVSEVGTAGLGQQQLVMRDGSGNVAGNWTYNVATGVSNTIAGPNASFVYMGDETSGQLELTFDSSVLANGAYSLRLFTKDQLSNGRSNIYGSVTFDNVAPSVSFDSPAPGSTVRDLTIDATMGGTGSNMKQYGFDVSGPGGLHFSTRNYQVDQPTVTVSDFDLCAAQYYGEDCPASLPNGSYTIRAKAYDKAGNRNITTILTLTVDTTAPVVDAGGDQTVTGLSATLSGTSDDATTYEWTKVSGSGSVSFTDASAAVTNVSVSAYGSYVFQLEGTDSVGNSNVDTVTVAFTQPVVIPTNDSTLPPVSPLGSTSNGQAGSSFSSVAPNFGTATEDTTTTDDNGEVLGTSTTDPKKDVAAVQTSDNGWNIFGLAWYWWVAILAALGLVWWGFSAWRTRRSDTF